MHVPEYLTPENGLEETLADLSRERQELLIALVSAHPETCVHEASHAVFAIQLNLPFDFVTVIPTIDDAGTVFAGQIHWGEGLKSATRESVENYALAALAPQIVMPRFGITRTTDEAKEEFSSDDFILDKIVDFNPSLTREYVRAKAMQMMTDVVLQQIYAVAVALKDKGTLTREEVKSLACSPI